MINIVINSDLDKGTSIYRVPTVLENPGKSLNLLKKIQAWKVLGN
jgi:hypothetical protein